MSAPLPNVHDDRARIAYGGLRRRLLIVWMAAVGVAAVVLIWLRPGAGSPLDLGTEANALSEALGWPMDDFPPITRVEREALARELDHSDSFRVMDLRLIENLDFLPETLAEDASTLNAQALQRLRAATAELSSRRAEVASSEQSREIDAYVTALTEARNLLGTHPALGWLPHYQRGIVYLWEDNPAAAAQDLQTASQRLQELTPSSGLGVEDLMEARALAFYGLGHAHLQRDDGPKAIEAFHRAGDMLKALFEAGAQSRAASQHDDMTLARSGLSSLAVWNDLVAAYLDTPAAGCPVPASMEPPCASPEADDPCVRRNGALCAAAQRRDPHLGPMLDAALDARMDRPADAEGEARAVGILIELTTASPELHDHPWLNANVALLGLRTGAVEHALAAANRAIAATGIERDPGVLRFPVDDQKTAVGSETHPGCIG